MGLDAARVLATLGIVWVHVAEIQKQQPKFNTLGRFGTSFYILAAIFLAARGHIDRPDTRTIDVAGRRARRLLVPYLLWSAIYAVFYGFTMRSQGHPWEAITRHWGLLFGTAPHLWFLPFAFVAGVAASFLVPRLLKLPGWFLIYGGLFLTLGAYVFVYAWAYRAIDQPYLDSIYLNRLDRWTEEAPMVLGAIFGVAIYGKYLNRLSRIGRSKRIRLSRICFFAFILTQIAYCVFLDDLGSYFWNRVRFFSNIAGAFWMIAFLAAWRGKWTRRLAPLGGATYFAYLSHQMILDGVKSRLTDWPGYGSLCFAILSTLAIYGLAVALGFLVRRVKILRWLSP